MQLLEVPLARQDETTPDIRLDLVEANANLDGIEGRDHGLNEQERAGAVKAGLEAQS
ncbi:hypothetical protein ACMDCR_00775 [Labrys okinawensis]|uniref:hypothetical protein n=1 Tax=Labrys okinawensis TaxID=346911 RepID=UPI0039BD1150